MKLYKFKVTVREYHKIDCLYSDVHVETGNTEEEAKINLLKKLIDTKLGIPNRILNNSLYREFELNYSDKALVVKLNVDKDFWM